MSIKYCKLKKFVGDSEGNNRNKYFITMVFGGGFGLGSWYMIE